MHDAGAGVERHVVAQVHRREPVVERMAEARVPRAPRPCTAATVVPVSPKRARQASCRSAARIRYAARRVDQVVDEIGMDVERLVGGHRPGRRGPDHRKARACRRGGRLAAERVRAKARAMSPVRKREAHVDRRILAVLVFDLGLGERRAAVEAPVHRLQPAVQIARLQQAAEGRGSRRPRCAYAIVRVRMRPSRRAPRGAGSPSSGARSARWRRRGDRRCVSSAGRFRPCFFSICTSIGMPWQSQPGT